MLIEFCFTVFAVAFTAFMVAACNDYNKSIVTTTDIESSEETMTQVITDNQSLAPAGIEKLKQLIDKIEKLEEEKAGVQEDVKETYGEAKAFGFDTKILRKVIRNRKKSRQEREEEEAVEELYMAAVEGEE